jgi:hypothetical protein
MFIQPPVTPEAIQKEVMDVLQARKQEIADKAQQEKRFRRS